MCTVSRYKACEGCKEHVRGVPIAEKPGRPEALNSREAVSPIPQRDAIAIAPAPVPVPLSSPTSDSVPGSDVLSPAPVLVTKTVAVGVATDLTQEAAEMDVTASDVQLDNDDSKKVCDAMEINRVEVSNQNENDSQDKGCDKNMKEGGDEGGGEGEGGLNAADVRPTIKVEVKEEMTGTKAMDTMESEAYWNRTSPSFLKCTRCPSVYHHSCALEAMKSDSDSSAVADPRFLAVGAAAAGGRGAVTGAVERGWAVDGKWICPQCRYSDSPPEDNYRYLYLPSYCSHITTIFDCCDFTIHLLLGFFQLSSLLIHL